MGDVSQRGYRARFNLDGFLRSDTKTRYEAYKLGLEVGAITQDEIREARRQARPPRPPPADRARAPGTPVRAAPA